MKKLTVLLGLGYLTLFMSACSKLESKSSNLGSAQLSQGHQQLLSIDRPAPNSPAAFFKSTFELKGKCSGQGIVKISTTALPAEENTPCVSGAFIKTITLGGPDGLVAVAVSQVDGAGRTWADSVSITKDTSPPSVTIAEILQVPGTPGPSIQISGTCEAGLQVILSGDVLNASAASCSNGIFKTAASLTAGDGNKNLTLSQTDLANNRGLSERVFNVDSTAPIVTLTSPVANADVNSLATLVGTCESGIDLKIEGSGISTPMINQCLNGMYSHVVQFTPGDGPKDVSVSQQDAGGNVGAVSRRFNRITPIPTTVDTTAPIVLFTSPASGSSTNGKIQLQGSCESGLNVKIAGSVATSLTTLCTNGTFSAAATLAAGEGAKTVSIAQTDAAGNVGMNTRSFVLDSISPKVTIVKPSSATFTNSKALTVTGTCESGIPVVLYGAGVAANVSAPCSASLFSAQVTLLAGDATKEVRAGQTDLAGNSSSVLVNISLDTTAPTLSFVSPNAGTLAEVEITVTGNCEDGIAVFAAGSGLASMSQSNCSAKAFTATLIFSTGDGAKLVQLSQTDSAGNTTTVTRSFTRGPILLDGVALYTSNCMGCHGALATSTKIGKTGAQILAARSAVSNMLSNAGLQALSNNEINAIAAALTPATLPKLSKFQCVNSSARGLSTNQMKRLPKYELVNTLTSLFGASVVADPNIQNQLDTMAAESNRTAMVDGSPNPPGEQPLAMLSIANRLVDLIAASSSLRTRIFGSCAAASPITATCASSFISAFGLQVYRRPLTATETTSMLASFNLVGGTEGLNRILMRLLLSPSLVYHIELGGAIQLDRVRLTDYEIASRISYALSGTLPDSLLLQAAGRGELQSIDNVRLHAKRLVNNDSNAKSQVGEFFRLYTASDQIPTPFAPAGQAVGIDVKDLNIEMTQELNDYVNNIVWSKKGNFTDLLTSREVFPRSDRMAKILEAPKVLGTTPALTSAQHAGLILRPGSLAGPGSHTSAYPRAAQIRTGYLCEVFGSPDAAGAAAREEQLGDLSNLGNRDRLTLLTNATQCIGCHSSLNPVGFALEGYSQLGMIRPVESVFDSSGKIVATHPVNTIVGRSYIADGTGTEVMSLQNAVDLNNAISEGYLARACFVQRIFEFQTARRHISADECALSEVEKDKGSVLDAFALSVANEDIFWKAKGN